MSKTTRMVNWVVVLAYDCSRGNRGDIISRHSTYELASRAARGDSFAAIKHVNDVVSE